MIGFYSIKAIGTALVISGLLVLLPGCEKKGDAEKAGEKIDNAIESVKEKVEEAKDSLTNKGPAEKAGEKIDKAIENAKE